MLKNFPAVCLCAIAIVAARPAFAADATLDALNKAKQGRTDLRAIARTTLLKAIDDKIKSLGAAGDLEGLKALTTQKDAFVAGGILPIHPAVKDASAAYDATIKKADGQLVAAYEVAIDNYNRDQKFNEATALRQERRALLEGGGASPVAGAPAVAGGAPQAPEMISATLKQAKAVHEQALASAKATFLTAIDSKTNTASEAGDLKSVTALRTAKASVTADGSLPAEMKDPTILSAKTSYDVAVKTADANLLSAYQSAIREYTRAQKIDEATAVQAELDASTLAKPATAAANKPKGPAVEPATHFGKLLPPLFNATGGYSAARDGGVTPAKDTKIITKPADFLSPTRDWVFDIWMHVEHKSGWGFVGIGDGKLDESLTIAVKAPGDQHHGIYITHGDEWGQKIADLREPGDYLVRIEKTGNTMTFSFGTEKDGQFEVDATRTINDPKAFMSKLSEKSAHLFFDGGHLYKQYRLTFRAPGTPSDTPAKTPVAEPVNPKKKKK